MSLLLSTIARRRAGGELTLEPLSFYKNQKLNVISPPTLALDTELVRRWADDKGINNFDSVLDAYAPLYVSADNSIRFDTIEKTLRLVNDLQASLFNNSFTITIRMKVDVIADGREQVIFSKKWIGRPNGAFRFCLNPSLGFQFDMKNNSGNNNIFRFPHAGTGVENNTWFTVQFIFDTSLSSANRFNVYVNNTQLPRLADSFGLDNFPTCLNPVFLGKGTEGSSNTFTESFIGNIKGMRFDTKALNEQERLYAIASFN